MRLGNIKFFTHLTLILLSLLGPIAIAKEKVTPVIELELHSLAAIKSSQASGDKVYITITEYPKTGEPLVSRTPMAPLHWLAKDLPHINNVKLWRNSLAEGESVLIIISILEATIPLIEADKHIGSVQAVVTNHKGKITVKWGQPHFVDQPFVEQIADKKPTFIMFGAESQYKVAFKVTMSRN